MTNKTKNCLTKKQGTVDGVDSPASVITAVMNHDKEVGIMCIWSPCSAVGHGAGPGGGYGGGLAGGGGGVAGGVSGGGALLQDGLHGRDGEVVRQ